MRHLAAIAAFVVSFVLVAVAAGAMVLVLAGPHSDLLPMALQVVVYVAAWAAVLGVPFVVARAVWRRTAPSKDDGHA